LIFRCLLALAAMLAVGPARAADRIPVVATFSVIGDMLANVGGDHIDIKTIVGVGGDCPRKIQMSVFLQFRNVSK
jgi:zinc/manganese transport system substrate-binding protein